MQRYQISGPLQLLSIMTDLLEKRIKSLGSMFVARQARHEYSQVSLIRLIISYNLLMCLLNFLRLKTSKIVHYVSIWLGFFIETKL